MPTSVDMYYRKVLGDRLYPYTSPGTLNPSFTKTSISVPGGSVTFYVREGTEMSEYMKNILESHNLPNTLPDERGGISRLD